MRVARTPQARADRPSGRPTSFHACRAGAGIVAGFGNAESAHTPGRAELLPGINAPRRQSQTCAKSRAQTRAAALAAVQVFKEKYGVEYQRGVACLTKDTDAFPALYGLRPFTPRRALGSPAQVEPDRERPRHRQTSNDPDEGRAFSENRQAHASSPWSAQHRRSGVASRARTSCPAASTASVSSMASPTETTPRPSPPDRARRPRSAIARWVMKGVWCIPYMSRLLLPPERPSQKVQSRASRLDMSLIMEIWIMVWTVAAKRSKSMASRRLMRIHAKVRPTIQRFARTTTPGSERRTISTVRGAASATRGPVLPHRRRSAQRRGSGRRCGGTGERRRRDPARWPNEPRRACSSRGCRRADGACAPLTRIPASKPTASRTSAAKAPAREPL